MASFFFCVFMDLDFVSVHKHAKKELGQYPAILTSRLVNNPYFFPNSGVSELNVKKTSLRGNPHFTWECLHFRPLSFFIERFNFTIIDVEKYFTSS